jgi:hypothetical protein
MAKTSPAAKHEDPILDAISRHNERFRLFCALSDRAEVEDRAETKADKAATEAASNAEGEALEALIATAPQTIAGLRAAIEHLVQFDEGSEPVASGRFLGALLKSPLLAGGTKEAAPIAQVDEVNTELEARRNRFNALYCRWLQGRAAIVSPEADPSDEATDKLAEALGSTERELLMADVPDAEMIWKKMEVLEHFLSADLLATRSITALACIKEDLMSHGIGRGD